MTTAPDYRVVGVNLPSLLPLQAAPQSEEQVLNYLQALHNYMAGDRVAVVQALNVLSRDRMLAAEVWDDLMVSADSVRVPTVGGPTWAQMADDGDGSDGVFLPYFHADTENSVWFSRQLPHGYKQGTNIEAHVHWVPSESDGPSRTFVSWGLEYTWININEVFGDTVIAYANETVQDVDPLVLNQHYMTDIVDIAGSGQTISSMIVCRLFRDATGAGETDDFPGTAGLLEFDFHYRADSVGSPDEHSKAV
jgi:hypothetical protein